MVVIAWMLDLHLPMQLVPITTKVVSSNLAHGEVYSIQHYVINFVSDLRQVGSFLLVLLFPPPIKLTAHDVVELFLKVALNTITLALKKTACWCYYRNVYYINMCANNAWSTNVLLIVDYYYPDQEMINISRMREIKLQKQRAIEKKIIHCILFKFLDCILFVDIHNCLIGIQLNIVKKTYIRMHINNIISRLWRVIKGWT